MDLWIVPPHSNSNWFTRLDWYLNWQMCKALAHRHLPPPAEVFRLAHDYGIPVDENKTSNQAPLMVACAGKLPTDACVVLEFESELKDWLTKANTIAFQMQAKSARIYLPTGQARAKALGIWEKLRGTCTAEFMEDHQEQI